MPIQPSVPLPAPAAASASASAVIPQLGDFRPAASSQSQAQPHTNTAALYNWMQNQLALQAANQLPLQHFTPTAASNGGISSMWQPLGVGNYPPNQVSAQY